MDTVSTYRVAVLRALSNCPACGSRVSVHGVLDQHFSTLFKCGAIFDVRDGQPLTFLKSCPAPSAVAVAMLNAQAEKLAAAGTPEANIRPVIGAMTSEACQP